MRQSSYHYITNHSDAIPTDIMWPLRIKVRYAFHEFTVQKL
jgi:hypothetical protein